MLTSRQEVKWVRQFTEVDVANRSLSLVHCASARLAAALRFSVAYQRHASCTAHCAPASHIAKLASRIAHHA